GRCAEGGRAADRPCAPCRLESSRDRLRSHGRATDHRRAARNELRGLSLGGNFSVARRGGGGEADHRRVSHARRQSIAMLKTTLIHPEILRIVARAGHHAKILIADGNYPASTKRGPYAEVVCLQLTPGVPPVAQVLRAVLSAVPVDALNTIGLPAADPYAKFGEPSAW